MQSIQGDLSAFPKKIDKLCLNLSILNRFFDTPEEFRPVVREVWEISYAFRTQHLKFLAIFLRHVRLYCTNLSLTYEDFQSCKEDIYLNSSSLSKLAENTKSMFIELVFKTDNLTETFKRCDENYQKKVINLEKEIKFQRKEIEQNEKKLKSLERVKKARNALSSIISVAKSSSEFCGLDTEITWLEAIKFVVDIGDLASDSASKNLLIEKAEMVSNLAQNEIDIGKASEILGYFTKNITTIIKDFSELVESLTKNVNICANMQNEIISGVENNRLDSKRIYQKIQNEAKAASSRCLNLLGVIPIAESNLDFITNLVIHDRKNCLSNEWKDYISSNDEF
mmetsp:Transcript_20471/g.30303  ORF Transcript_20471/g.30303 Transcript_20471/m.30303 type:complete len:339 (-) Transcript_20471:100-1116(-)